MKPKLNKLIMLLMLLSTFTFLMEIEERVSPVAKKELSKWVSLLPISSLQLPAQSDSSSWSPLFTRLMEPTDQKKEKEEHTVIN